MIEALAQAEFKVGAQPLTLFAHYTQNQEASDLDTGYSAGFVIGKAANPHTWEFGYTYQKTEKDAQFGQFVDSDFGGGHHGRRWQCRQVRLCRWPRTGC